MVISAALARVCRFPLTAHFFCIYFPLSPFFPLPIRGAYSDAIFGFYFGWVVRTNGFFLRLFQQSYGDTNYECQCEG
jgi:hypothetical protein